MELTPLGHLPAGGQFNCANCSKSLPNIKNSFARFFKLVDGKTTAPTLLSIHQALSLVFNDGGNLNSHLSDGNSVNLKLCLPCGDVFGKLLKNYKDFLGLTGVGSYVQNLMKNMKCSNLKRSWIGTPPPDVQSDSKRKESRKRQRMIPSLVNTSTRSDQKSTLTEVSTNKPVLSDKVNCEIEPVTPIDEPNPRKLCSLSKSKSKGKSNKLNLLSSPTTYSTSYEVGILNIDDHKDAEFIIPQILSEESEDDEPLVFVPPTNPARSRKQEHSKSKVQEEVKLFSDDEHYPSADGEKEFINDMDGLLETKCYKCDKCVFPSIFEFDTFKKWVHHQQDVHHLCMGYGPIETKRSLQPQEGLPRPCPQCGKQFTTCATLLSHINRIHLKMNIFKCDVCAKEFRSFSWFDVHRKNETCMNANFLTTNFRCTVCGILLPSEASLEKHQRSHFESPQLINSNSDFHQESDCQSKLLIHRSPNIGQRHYSCHECDLYFTTLRRLKGHVNTQHARTVRPKRKRIRKKKLPPTHL